MTAWLADGVGVATVSPPGPVPGAGWVEATVRAVHSYVAGQAPTAGVVPALALADEVIKGLAMSQWKLAMIVLTALGTTSATAVGLSGSGGGQGAPAPGGATAPGAAQAAPVQKPAPPAIKPLPEPAEVMLPKLRERILNAAAQRLDAQRAYYEEGRITIDRFLQALEFYYQAQMAQAKTREERILAAQKHFERVAEVLNREQAELKVGRGTVADTAEAQLAHELAAIEWAKAHQAPAAGDVEALQKRVEALEKQLEDVRKHLDRSGNGRN
jgi:hypothetical protein